MSEEKLTKLTRKEAMLEALELTLGIVTDACKIIGIARQTHYDWMASDEVYKKAVESIMEVSLDFVESKLFETIRGVELPEDKVFCFEGEPVIVPTTKRYPPSDANIRWYLDRKGRKRGYVAEPETANDTNKLTPAQFVEAMVSATTPRNVPPETIGVVE